MKYWERSQNESDQNLLLLTNAMAVQKDLDTNGSSSYMKAFRVIVQ